MDGIGAALGSGFGAMGLFSWIAMGLLAGAVARYLLPGSRPLGCLATVAVGVAGAVLGGLAATLLDFGGISGFDVRSLLIATLGAVLLLLVLGIARLAGGKPAAPTKR